MEYMIQCEHIEKIYRLKSSRHFFSRRKEQESETAMHQALHDISIQIKPGEVIGLVGLNGSGKTTLSRIIAGLSKPTSGKVTVNGTVGMLAANAGLNGALTGRENIYYKCLLLGFSLKQITEMEDSIIAFAELEKFIDQPLKTFSSGMRSRLGFAVCTHTNPDILIVDEALAVGDQSFMDKCVAWMHAFIAQGHSVIFVSHSTNQMKGLCDRVMWLHQGECVGLGTVEEILPSYQDFAKEYNSIRNTPEALLPQLTKFQQRIDEAKKKRSSENR